METLRNLARRKLRNGLTVAGIALGITALVAMGSMAESFNGLVDQGVNYFGSDVLVSPDANGGAGGVMQLSKVEELQAVPGVAAAYPQIQLLAKPHGVTGVNFNLVPDMITALEPDELSYWKLRPRVATGRGLAYSDHGAVVLGAALAREFKVGVGGTVYLPVRPKNAKPDFVNHPFQVIGIYQPEAIVDEEAFITLPDGQMLMRDNFEPALRQSLNVSNLANYADVYGRPGTNLDELANTINKTVSGVTATPPSTLVDNFRSTGAVFSAITMAVALLALIVGGLSVINTMLIAVGERVREIGVRRAVGAHTTAILGEFLLESTTLGLIAGLIGLAAGLVITLLLNGANSTSNITVFVVTPRLVIVALGFAGLLSAAAGLFPAWRAARLDPVRALRYQG